MAWYSPPFVRPLLGACKSDLLEFLRRRGQRWREDPSNLVPKYTRNRVRWASNIDRYDVLLARGEEYASKALAREYSWRYVYPSFV